MREKTEEVTELVEEQDDVRNTTCIFMSQCRYLCKFNFSSLVPNKNQLEFLILVVELAANVAVQCASRRSIDCSMSCFVSCLLRLGKYILS